MKKDIVEYVARCLNCQQVKYEHQRPGGLLQKLEISECKWDRITMDFVVGLPRTQRRWLELLKDYDITILYYSGRPMWWPMP